MQFTDAYTGCCVGVPSRWSLMTGYHTGHMSKTNGSSLLTNTSFTVAKMLQKGGYETALFGLWALDENLPKPLPPSEGFPTLQGFNIFLGQNSEVEGNNYYPSWMYRQKENSSIPANINATSSSCGADHNKCLWSGDYWTTEAASFIANHAQYGEVYNATHAANATRNSQPFFLLLSYTTPQAGDIGTTNKISIPAPRMNASPYSNRTSWPRIERDFATAVWDLDTAIGKIVSAIDEAGLRNDTIIFFASDNGPHNDSGHNYLFFNSSGIFNGFKASIHDGGHRTGFIARWPSNIPAGALTWQQFVFYDFLPTMADLIDAPESWLPKDLDGQSILQTLLQQEEHQPDFIYHDAYSCRDPICDRNTNLNCDFCQNIRMGNWSGVCVGPSRPCTGKTPGKFFLYDMSVDAAQQTDVSLTHPSIVEQLLGIMSREYQLS